MFPEDSFVAWHRRGKPPLKGATTGTLRPQTSQTDTRPCATNRLCILTLRRYIFRASPRHTARRQQLASALRSVCAAPPARAELLTPHLRQGYASPVSYVPQYPASKRARSAGHQLDQDPPGRCSVRWAAETPADLSPVRGRRTYKNVAPEQRYKTR